MGYNTVTIETMFLFCHNYVCFSNHANVLATLSGHASWVLSVAFSPDNGYFASSSADHTVKLWQLDSRSCLHTFKDHNDQV